MHYRANAANKRQSSTNELWLQGDVNSKDKAVGDLKRWLDQAQGQLQNTQAALHEREADCKTLAADLKAALAHLTALKVRLRLQGTVHCCMQQHFAFSLTRS